MTWIEQNITTHNYDLNLSNQKFKVINNIPKGRETYAGLWAPNQR